MILKVFKGVWFLSLVIFLIIFIYDYASLPSQVIILEEEVPFMVSRDVLFYSLISLVAIINMLVFVVSRLFPETEEDFKSWFYGLVITLNIFFIVCISFIGLYNSTEKFDYDRIGIIIYGSLALFAIWTISWPIYRLVLKYFSKQPV